MAMAMDDGSGLDEVITSHRNQEGMQSIAGVDRHQIGHLLALEIDDPQHLALVNFGGKVACRCDGFLAKHFHGGSIAHFAGSPTVGRRLRSSP